MSGEEQQTPTLFPENVKDIEYELLYESESSEDDDVDQTSVVDDDLVDDDVEEADTSELSEDQEEDDTESSEKNNHSQKDYTEYEESSKEQNPERDQTAAVDDDKEVDTEQVDDMSDVDQQIETLLAEINKEMELLYTSESSEEQNHSQQENSNEDDVEVDDDEDSQKDNIEYEESSKEQNLESDQTASNNDDDAYEESSKEEILERDDVKEEVEDVNLNQLFAIVLSEINKEIEVLDTELSKELPYTSESPEEHSLPSDDNDNSSKEQNLETHDDTTQIKNMNVFQLVEYLVSQMQNDKGLYNPSASSKEHNHSSQDQINQDEHPIDIPTSRLVDGEQQIYPIDKEREISEEITEKTESIFVPEVNIIKQYRWNDVTIVDKVNIALTIFLILCFIVIMVQIGKLFTPFDVENILN